MHPDPLLGQVQRGRQAADAAADHQRVRVDGDEPPFERLEETRLGDRHPDEVPRLLRRRLGLAHVDPRALVADVRHLEQIRIEARLAKRVAEQRLVGARRARRDDDPVEAVLGDLLADSGLRVARAGVEVFLGVDDVWEPAGVLRYRGHVDDPADVPAAVADEHADPRLLAGDVALLRVGSLGEERTSHVGEKGHCPGGGGARLDDRLGDVLRLDERPADEHPVSRARHRPDRGGPREPIGGQPDSEPLGERLGARGRLEAGREDDEIERIGREPAFFPLVADPIPAAVGRELHGARPASHVLDPELDRPIVVGVEPLSEGAHVHVEDRALQVIAGVLLGDDRFLRRVHAADRRAVVVLLVSRADALDERDPFRRPPVRRPQDVPAGRAGRREDPLELDAGDDVVEADRVQLDALIRVVRLEARREDDRAHVQLDDLLDLRVVDRVGATRLLALAALRANRAVEAPLRLRDRLLLGVADLDLGEVPDPVGDGEDARADPRLPVLPPRRHRRKLLLRGGGRRRVPLVSEVLAVEKAID